MVEDERALVARIRAGDVRAFETVFRGYRAALVWLAARYTPSHAGRSYEVRSLFASIADVSAANCELEPDAARDSTSSTVSVRSAMLASVYIRARTGAVRAAVRPD